MRSFRLIQRYVRPNDRPLIRDIDGERYFESFLVAAIASVLVIRFALYATSYTQLSGGGLHIAHVLFGGVLMLFAVVVSLAFVNRPAKHLTAILGGIGFGAFIDELGKFITKDNNYFFEPTPSLIYTVFVLLFIWFRNLEKRQTFSDKEHLVNALNALQEAIVHDLDAEEKRWAFELLDRCDQNDPLVKNFRELLAHTEPVPTPHPRSLTRLKTLLHDLYHLLVKQQWFTQALVLFFVLQSTAAVLEAIAIMSGALEAILSAFVIVGMIIGISGIFKNLPRMTRVLLCGGVTLFLATVVLSTPILTFSPQTFSVPPAPSFAEWGELFSSAAAGTLVLIGVSRIRASRLFAYKMFHRAMLVSIFLTQFFLFFQSQFLALLGLAFNILILATLNYMITQEERLLRETTAASLQHA